MHYKKHRSRIDNNQNDIVRALRKLPGVTVAVNHDDILVGYKGKTYWFEIKEQDIRKNDGAIRKGALKPSQEKLLVEWAGAYKIVWSLDQILKEMGIIG